MGAIGFVLFVLGLLYFGMFHEPYGEDPLDVNLSFAALGIGAFLMLISITAWLWNVMP